MTNLMQANRNWATRPADERFTSLIDLQRATHEQRANSRAVVVSSRKLEVRPSAADSINSIEVHGPNGHGYTPTHWSFGQLAARVGAPPSYLRTLPAPLVADNLNYGLRFGREVADIGVLLRKNGNNSEFAAVTGPQYGRIWNSQLADELVSRFGDGISGQWRMPGEFSRAVPITKDNTTIFAGDRDMFVFLADEQNRIELPNRRDGRIGSLARGFFVWNSEVGSTSIGVAFFLYDYVCANRIVWGVQQFQQIRMRHTVSAPDRWLEEVSPILVEYSNAAAKPVLEHIEAARAAKIDNDVNAWLAKRYNTRLAAELQSIHQLEEGAPISSLWDVATAITARARRIQWQDERVAMEREAGRVLDLVAA